MELFYNPKETNQKETNNMARIGMPDNISSNGRK
jgi:hypothetical protein